MDRQRKGHGTVSDVKAVEKGRPRNLKMQLAMVDYVRRQMTAEDESGRLKIDGTHQ